MAQISKAVRGAVAALLADPTVGFNPNLAAAISTTAYGTATAFTVDWSATSKQFFQGQIHPDDIDDTTPSTYPMVMLYSLSSVNQNLQKFTEFSGAVSIGIDVHLSWKATKALPAFDDLVDAVEDAVFATMNAAANQGWTMPVIYNGDLVAQRRPIDKSAAENWRQTISFRATFELVTN